MQFQVFLWFWCLPSTRFGTLLAPRVSTWRSAGDPRARFGTSVLQGAYTTLPTSAAIAPSSVLGYMSIYTYNMTTKFHPKVEWKKYMCSLTFGWNFNFWNGGESKICALFWFYNMNFRNSTPKPNSNALLSGLASVRQYFAHRTLA